MFGFLWGFLFLKVQIEKRDVVERLAKGGLLVLLITDPKIGGETTPF